ncbi:uncharacterized protein LOC126842676 isoform X2 [Adelges cooleyi]|uniref:uncharacterized protein LOC126842676 isoform X2 n=1 Tax=Adelges cooleyi TaxID=133065 RepID=UPI0021807372|nr:uncharacterized protein LOC126842676 isoform X2 [Adelges cooleyi]
MLFFKIIFSLTGLLATLYLGHGLPIDEGSVSKLMTSSPVDDLGLVKYFKQLDLYDTCDIKILDVNKTKHFEINNPELCMCTIIYNMTKELSNSNVSVSDVELAKTQTANFDAMALYDIWTKATVSSPSLTLFMEPLNSFKRWHAICYNVEDEIKPLCKMLNVEVLSMKNVLPKSNQPIKPPKDDKLLAKVEEPKKPDLPLTVPKIPNNVVEKSKDTQDLTLVHEEQEEEANAEKLVEKNPNEDQIPKSSDDKEDEMEQPPITDENIPIEEEPVQPKSLEVKNTQPSAENKSNPQNTFPAFPKKKFMTNEFSDSEDTHFLFYFVVMTVISLGFYLALYNKKKIIALVIEGRRSNSHRRRPNVAGYSKVETDDGSTVF